MNELDVFASKDSKKVHKKKLDDKTAATDKDCAMQENQGSLAQPVEQMGKGLLGIYENVNSFFIARFFQDQKVERSKSIRMSKK